MNCFDSEHFLEAYADNELDLGRALDIERHLDDCPACRQRVSSVRSLRRGIGNARLYRTAPASLKSEILKKLAPSSVVELPRFRSNRGMWLAAAAALLLAVLLLGVWFRPGEPKLVAEVVDGHRRSLLAAHLADVMSTDRHTVKPWFQGKLDFSPKVEDPAEQGFPLVGGRLDLIADRPVAALVYRRGEHRINLFTWPEAGGRETGIATFSRQGFNVVHWCSGEMNFWAVSDLNQDELRQFAALLRK